MSQFRTIPNLTPLDLARIWSGVAYQRRVHTCWLWRRAVSRHGYGIIRLHDGKTYTVSRLVAHLFLGKAPNNRLACHRCDNPPCCNPRHLFYGSMRDNLLDAAAKGRTSTQRHPKFGTDNNASKLNWEIVAIIRNSVKSSRVLASQFEVSPTTIKDIRTWRTWCRSSEE